MSVIIIPRKRLRQLQGRAEVDWANPITEGLIFASAGASDAVTTSPLVLVPDGLGFKSSELLPVYRAADDVVAFTVMGDVEFTSNNGDWAALDYGYYVSGTQNMNTSIGLMGSENILYATCRKDQGSITTLKTISFPYRATLALSGAIGTGATAYENGISIGAVASAGAHSPDSRRRFSAFTNTTAGKKAYWQSVWKRALSAAEIAEAYRDPWQLFRADPIRIYSLPSGPISLSWSSLTASNITQTGARLTLGGIVR